MSSSTAGIVFLVSMVLALALSWRPLGDYMARVFESKHHLRVERPARWGRSVNAHLRRTPRT